MTINAHGKAEKIFPYSPIIFPKLCNRALSFKNKNLKIGAAEYFS